MTRFPSLHRARSAVAFVAALGASVAAWADVTATDFWVRGTVAQQPATGAFGRLHSAEAATLLQVRSSIAGRVEIHEMSMQGDVMRMQALPGGLPLPAGQEVVLRPGSYHVMLLDLKEPVQAGQTVDLTLVVGYADGRRQEIAVKAPVRALGAASGASAAPPMHEHSGHMKH